jgi:phage terminase large subunit
LELKPITLKFERHFKVAFLAEPHPYKVLYGGRDGIKSWSVARQLIIDALAKPLRTLCCRETMMSLDESVKQLLADQTHLLKLDAHFQILNSEIRGINGSLFSFAGLRTDARKIKSFEGYDRAWVEEANNVSGASWHILLPTIRKENSEIWVTFNPELESDYTFKYWVMQPPPGSVVKKISYEDNIWLSEKSRREIEFMRQTDPEGFANIYGGECIRIVKGAVFEREMRAVDQEQRITRILYNNAKPVETVWDLGDRYTSIWFVQNFPFETRLIDYLDSEGAGITHILKELQRRQYVYGTFWLPFDARMPQLGTGRTLEEQIRSAGFKVAVVPRVSVRARLNMLRLLFPQLWFDGDRCSDGIQYLRHYKWPEEGIHGELKAKPVHDINSHAADSLSYLAVVLKTPINQEQRPVQRRPQGANLWA